MKQTSEKSEVPAAELQTGDEKDSEQTGAKKSGTRVKNIYSRPSVKFSFTLSTHESQLIFRHTIRKMKLKGKLPPIPINSTPDWLRKGSALTVLNIRER